MALRERIDIHTHYLPPAYQALLARHKLKLLDGGIPVPAWSPELQFSNMERLSVTYAVLSISSPHLHMGDKAEAVGTARGCNEYGAELARRYPEKISIAASLPLPEIEPSIAEIRHCREKLHICTFSLLTNSCGVYLGDSSLEPVMEELNRERTVVTIHPTEPPVIPHGADELPYPFMEFFFETTRAVTNMLIHGTIRRYPNIRFVVPHAGAFLPILSDRLAVLSKAFAMEGNELRVKEDLASLYYDLGGIAMPKQYGVLRQITDDTHLLYGSDGTFTPIDTCEKLVAEMDNGLDEPIQELIYHTNPLALLGKI